MNEQTNGIVVVVVVVIIVVELDVVCCMRVVEAAEGCLHWMGLLLLLFFW